MRAQLYDYTGDVMMTFDSALYFSFLILLLLLFEFFGYSFLPALLGGIALSGLINSDFQDGKATNRQSIIVGAMVGTLIALGVSFYLNFNLYHFEYYFILVDLPGVILAALVGGWTGSQVFNDITQEISGGQK